MKLRKLLLPLLCLCSMMSAQIPGYYNGTENKTGTDLKAALHEIINNHIDFSYKDAKYIINYAQEDPDNTSNVIQFYTNRSVSKDIYGTGKDSLNREHVWAKSHGDFWDVRPMDGDAHNLHAADASVNIQRSNYDFAEVENGTYVEEADAYYGASSFEPSDRDKGEVARTLMYMAVRYEGTNGELDLELEDRIGTAPAATHGKLSDLLEWNRQFPPTDFERRRNDRVEQCQGNRNPFTDNPEWADIIWAEASAETIEFSDVSLSPEIPKPNAAVTVDFNLAGATDVHFFWGADYASVTNEVFLTASLSLPDLYIAEVSEFTGIAGGEQVICKVFYQNASVQDSAFFTFYLEADDALVSIADVQGDATASPYANQTVAIAGIVTANYDNTFYVQQSQGEHCGIAVYSNFRGHVGDSVKVVGDVVEYNGLTEMTNVSSVYTYGQQGSIEPLVVGIAGITEAHEGMLVELKGVLFTEGGGIFPDSDKYPYPTFTINDGVNNITFYARYGSRLGNMPIPNGTINLTATVSEYKGVYQLSSNDTSWFEATVDVTPPAIIGVELEKISDTKVWMYVSFNEVVTEASVEEENNFVLTDDMVIARNYYNTTAPNQAKIWTQNVKAQTYTLTVSNIEDAYGNILTSASVDFTSDVSTALDRVEIGERITLYPVPVTGSQLSLQSQYVISEVHVYDLAGKMLMHQADINQRNLELDLSSLDNGNYLLKVNTSEGVTTKKILKQ